MMIHLIDELEQVVLRWVHAHRPHGPAELLGADVSTPVNVKLIERLQSRIYSQHHPKQHQHPCFFDIVSNKKTSSDFVNNI